MENVKQKIHRLVKIITKPEMRVLPGQIAFFLVLSIIPMLSLIGAVASKFQISIDSFINALTGTMPRQVIDILVPAFNSPSFLTSASLFLGFIVASNGITSIIISSNMLFKINTRNYLLRRVKAFVMLIMLVILFLIMIIVLAFGNSLLSWIFELIYNEKLPWITYYTFSITKWVVGISIAFVMLKLLFTMAPDANISSKYMNSGALITSIAWGIATFIYAIYVNNIANYNVFYGGLAGIVALMFWVYILSYSLVVGIAVNSEVYLQKKD